MQANSFRLTGAIRRQVPTLESIDIITDTDKEIIKQQFGVTNGVELQERDGVLLVNAPNQLLIKVHFAGADNFYNTLFSTTASEEFLTAFNKQYKLYLTTLKAKKRYLNTTNSNTFILHKEKQQQYLIKQPNNSYLHSYKQKM